jgi:hypothetical protein
LKTDIEALSGLWSEAAGHHPVARRFLPWAESMLDAARISAGCGLEFQTEVLVTRVQGRLESLLSIPVHTGDVESIPVVWESAGLPSAPENDRQQRIWRRVRSMRSHRMPFRGEGHPEAQGLAWGPYNRQSAVAEALSAVASVDPLWVDDLLERERSLRTVDALLGLG